jgi:pantothenate synthetase
LYGTEKIYLPKDPTINENPVLLKSSRGNTLLATEAMKAQSLNSRLKLTCAEFGLTRDSRCILGEERQSWRQDMHMESKQHDVLQATALEAIPFMHMTMLVYLTWTPIQLTFPIQLLYQIVGL